MSKVISRFELLPSGPLTVAKNTTSPGAACRLYEARNKPGKLAWLRAVLSSTVGGMYGLAWEFPGIGLHISAGNGARLNAKGDIILVNLDRALIANFARATRQAVRGDAVAGPLGEFLQTAAGAPWSGQEAEEFARRVLEIEPLSAVSGFQVAAGSGAIVVPERVPVVHADRQEVESVQCSDLLVDLQLKPQTRSRLTPAVETTMTRVNRFNTDAPSTFKAATALTARGDVRHVDHILAGAVNPINGAVRIVHETDVHEHCHASRQSAKPFSVDAFLPALKAYLAGEGDDFLKAESPAIMPSHGSVVAVMPITASSGRHLQGQQLRFFLYVSHHKDDAAQLEDTVLDHHLELSRSYVKELGLEADAIRA